MLLLAAFIGVPLVEIAVFVEVGGAIGLWPTLGLVVLTAVLGAWQLRAQGLATLMRARNQVERGALPTRELFDGACLLVAGALLLTPGFVTDAAGFLLFFPPVRDILLGLLARHVQTRMQTRVFVDGEEVSAGGPNGPVIDGEYRDVTEPDGAGPERPRNLPK
ncbi:MAG: FxsA family protein [Proteobacteria bacterium]|nr:FxsA family protein [Pseudomonadota bacterium]